MNPKALFTAALLSSGALATGLFAAPALATADVSISIGQPGFYGRIDLGDAPRPRILYRQPVVIERSREDSEPIYLHVPPGHSRHWQRHCREYDACGRRVYFVRDDWYNNVYAPRYRERHGDRHDDGHDQRHDRHHRRDHDDNGRDDGDHDRKHN